MENARNISIWWWAR
ncbi:trpE operon leader peptide TrpLE [Ensifer adhaerens]|uniref:TrpE operon leader peptide TrpLE n=1 Tax=Ensifer adhaerens TaxID=106592 RepID=A0A9Q8YBQ8_ENSAD|nr:MULTISPECIES: trpE operon leader peptide TrpLE [Ensifer]MBD9495585.1 trpE operon leader peptide TrpLE [Ensifer sp. ENS01]MBD9523661.1 trpE operon leader peptide TrpLE [Ensifer sp. ENS02]MBD9541146.1 trpE operon leader peptide TrpLE [Ensifer sp. ENS04]MBD9557054.1 trpE operon leader peptide TrpLE [Ensifer sp. ENS03]MBD9570166.1 trpE operon leader peptide TrpLE [Ensifer sp. ENS08]